ncbi:hypothetical protein [Hoeflea poritis]|uniref:ATPase AAA-type core domain-containing protein n=1 Tax=Hoeflea poritis TaxID=2993659 RepID=A0ABT4VJ71_9HYPH|nr:hypothetical protein [Hoeflea poritis]MDA4844745.1 hypothetical protein [Hoeflea poritis]
MVGRKVLLLGDTSIDCFILHDAPKPPNKKNAERPDWQRHRQWRSWMLPGGVHMAQSFLDDLGIEADICGPTRISTGKKAVTRLASLATLRYVESKDGRIVKTDEPIGPRQNKVRIASLDGYQDIVTFAAAKGSAPNRGFGLLPEGIPKQFELDGKFDDLADYDAVIINDAGDQLRKECAALVKKALSRAAKRPEKPVIIKMHQPLLSGAVWKEMDKLRPANAVLILGAQDLREYGIELNHCLSWDAVVDDIDSAINGNPGIQSILDTGCQLVVQFDVEGAICIGSYKTGVRRTLIFDPTLHEGAVEQRNEGTLIGKMNCFLAHMTSALIAEKVSGHEQVANACLNALRGARSYAEKTMTLKMAGKSKDATAGELKGPKLERQPKKGNYRSIVLEPLLKESRCYDKRALIHQMTAELGIPQLAKRVVLEGKKILDRYPVGRFGDLIVVDRSEVEAYRAISRLISQYLDNAKDTKPLSIAVFGAPGSGKSFGVKQLVDKHEVPIREFNLSEAQQSDLPGYFHEIRDYNLAGETPLCFFDEFDSQGKSLVASFLAPMQDGKFRQGARVHPIGRGIFVFAGGTSRNYAEFYSPSKHDRDNDAGSSLTSGPSDEDLKIPDFSSRLRGYIDIGTLDAAGDLYPLRRAILLRTFIEELMPGIIGPDGEAAIADNLLHAFLTCEEYVHSARSIEQIVRMSSKGKWTVRFSVSDLPEPNQLRLHTDPKRFKQLTHMH